MRRRRHERASPVYRPRSARRWRRVASAGGRAGRVGRRAGTSAGPGTGCRSVGLGERRRRRPAAAPGGREQPHAQPGQHERGQAEEAEPDRRGRADPRGSPGPRAGRRRTRRGTWPGRTRRSRRTRCSAASRISRCRGTIGATWVASSTATIGSPRAERPDEHGEHGRAAQRRSSLAQPSRTKNRPVKPRKRKTALPASRASATVSRSGSVNCRPAARSRRGDRWYRARRIWVWGWAASRCRA